MFPLLSLRHPRDFNLNTTREGALLSPVTFQQSCKRLYPQRPSVHVAGLSPSPRCVPLFPQLVWFNIPNARRYPSNFANSTRPPPPCPQRMGVHLPSRSGEKQYLYRDADILQLHQQRNGQSHIYNHGEILL